MIYKLLRVLKNARSSNELRPSCLNTAQNQPSRVNVRGLINNLAERTTATVIKPGVEFQEIATNQLDGTFMASAAAVDGALVVRTEKAVYRLSDG